MYHGIPLCVYMFRGSGQTYIGIINFYCKLFENWEYFCFSLQGVCIIHTAKKQVIETLFRYRQEDCSHAPISDTQLVQVRGKSHKQDDHVPKFTYVQLNVFHHLNFKLHRFFCVHVRYTKLSFSQIFAQKSAILLTKYSHCATMVIGKFTTSNFNDDWQEKWKSSGENLIVSNFTFPFLPNISNYNLFRSFYSKYDNYKFNTFRWNRMLKTMLRIWI